MFTVSRLAASNKGMSIQRELLFPLLCRTKLARKVRYWQESANGMQAKSPLMSYDSIRAVAIGNLRFLAKRLYTQLMPMRLS